MTTNDFERFIRDAEGELSATRDTLNAYEKEKRELEARYRSENPRYQQVCDKCRQWREEVSFAQRHLDRARVIMAGSKPTGPASEKPGVVGVKEDVYYPGEPSPRDWRVNPVDKPRPVPSLSQPLEPSPMPPMQEPEPEQREVVTAKPSLTFPPGFVKTERIVYDPANPFKPLSPEAAAVDARFDRAYAKRAVRAWRSSYPLAVSYRHSSRFERQALTAEIIQHPDYDAWLDEGNHPINSPHHKRSYVEILKAATEIGIDVKAVRAKARNVHLDISNFGTQGVDYLWSDDE